MSMRSCRTVTGYGIDVEDITPSLEAQIAFIKKYLTDEYEEMMREGEAVCDISNTSDYLDFCQDWINEYQDAEGNIGFGALLAMAIQQNEDGFQPRCFQGSYHGEAIMYEDRQPWEMPKRVLTMKAADMDAIYEKYLDELGVSAHADRQSIEYWR